MVLRTPGMLAGGAGIVLGSTGSSTFFGLGTVCLGALLAPVMDPVWSPYCLPHRLGHRGLVLPGLGRVASAIL